MGYQDRDYFRDESSPYLDLIRSTRVCWGIVIVFSVVYLLCIFTAESPFPIQEYLRLDTFAMFNNWEWHRLFTASFVADNAWELVFALLICWMIGHELEQLVGGLEMLVFFIISCVLSNLALTLVYYFVLPGMPSLSFGPVGGAMALLCWAVLISPHRIVTYMFVPMPLWIVGVLTLIIDVFFFQALMPPLVRLAVHGFSLPFAGLYHVLGLRLTGWPRWPRVRRWPARRQLSAVLQMPQRNYAAETRENDRGPVPVIRAVDEQLEAKVDAILEKVSQGGMQSLSEDEKTTLKRASEMLKRKRS
ncbi:MAG: rhomboid family intramembrane serine protease [Gemmatales bacterium]